jgi:hypothetical protein
MLGQLPGNPARSFQRTSEPKEASRQEAESRLEAKLKRELATIKQTMKELLPLRADAARDAVKILLTKVEIGEILPTDRKYGVSLEDMSELLAEAELAMSRTPADRVAILERLWMIRRRAELWTKAMRDAGRVTMLTLALTQYYRLDAEIKLVKARQEKPGK